MQFFNLRNLLGFGQFFADGLRNFCAAKTAFFMRGRAIVPTIKPKKKRRVNLRVEPHKRHP